MRFIAAVLAAAPGAILADTIKITATTDLRFDPAQATAKEGDVLEFHFEPKNHSVAMGEFGSINGPCVPANQGGFFSGYMPTSDGENVRPVA
jgi:plastocyanin